MASVRNKQGRSLRNEEGHPRDFDFRDRKQVTYISKLARKLDLFEEKFCRFREKYPDNDRILKPCLEHIVNLICKIIFSTPVTASIDKDVVVCVLILTRLFSKMKSTEEKSALKEKLNVVFVKKLCERFTYKEQLQNLLKHRPICCEEKEKWLQHQYDIQGRLLKETDRGSVEFLVKLLKTTNYSSFVYEVLEALLKLPCNDKVLFDYINILLKEMKYRLDAQSLVHFQKIVKQAEKNLHLPQSTLCLLGILKEDLEKPAPQIKTDMFPHRLFRYDDDDE